MRRRYITKVITGKVCLPIYDLDIAIFASSFGNCKCSLQIEIVWVVQIAVLCDESETPAMSGIIFVVVLSLVFCLLVCLFLGSGCFVMIREHYFKFNLRE